MFVSMKANKKRMAAFLVLAAAVVAAVFFLRWQKEQTPQVQEYFGETNEERIAFLQSFGWQVEAAATEQREVMIPAEFDDVYQNYNAMQQAQGFDLAPYAGEIVTQYKYHVTNYPGETEVFATLLVYGRVILGGDLACAEVDGFMHGFAADSARYGEVTPKPSTQPEQPASSAVQEDTSSLASGSAADAGASAAESGGESSLVESQAEDTAAEPEEDVDWPTD